MSSSIPEMSEALREVYQLLCKLCEMQNPALLEHGRELAETSRKMANHLGWDARRRLLVYLGALFHDIGYLVLHGSVMCEAGDGERDDHLPRFDSKHAELGAELVSKVKCLRPIMPILRHHHENLDGSGYPDGLTGDAIPEMARLVAVAHTYITLRRGRENTNPMSDYKAREVILDDASVTLDPAMVEALLAILPEAKLPKSIYQINLLDMEE